MATNNIILAVPGADTAVNYTLPASESAKLSFSPEDVDGLRLDGNGGLVISFVEGGNVTLTNFQSFIDNGNTLSLSDGTVVDPKLLFTALGGKEDSQTGGDIVKIGVPAENAQSNITLEPGKKYMFDFDLSQTQGADMKDGKMVISFANGGKIVIDNYETAMASATPPELSIASKVCVVDGDDLITNIQNLAQANNDNNIVVVKEEAIVETKPKSKLAAADMDGQEDTGPAGKTAQTFKGKDLNKIETAAGDEPSAKDLANIETAAGNQAAGGRANSGYGFGSRPDLDPFATNADIGPINPTQLGYVAPTLTPLQFFTTPETPTPTPDGSPSLIDPDGRRVDETNLSGGPTSVSGNVTVDFGSDGPGGISPNGSFVSGGSLLGGALTSNGDAVTVSVVGNSYVGTTAGGEKVFDLVINPITGSYTFTQYLPLDHADGANPNDVITLNFGIVASDSDGDTVSTTIKIGVLDDAPSIAGATETVDETNLGPIVETGTLAVNFGQDGAGSVTPSNDFTASGSLKNSALTSSGVPVIVTATANGYTGTAGGVTVFTLTINPSTGAYTYTQYGNLDHADNSNANDIITLSFGATVTDFDGDTAAAPIVINVKDDAPTFQNDGPRPDHGLETVDETNLGPIVETGKLNANFGADTPGSYAFKNNGFTSSGSKLNGALTSGGVPVVVTIENGVYVGKANGTTVFTLELTSATGDYKFTLLEPLDHADGANPNDVITLDFAVIASDFEGDSVTGSIRINVKDDAPDAVNDSRTVGEEATISGNVMSNDAVGQDVAGKVTQVVFNGVTTVVPASGNVVINGTYGTLTINSTGAYSYSSKALNADGTDNFTYTLKDYDGDTDTAILSIQVQDGDTIPTIITPAADVVDETSLSSGTIVKTGSVVADFGDDGPGTIAGNNVFSASGSKLGGALSSGGVPVVVSYANGVYTGKAGTQTVFTLSIGTDGSYTYRQFEQLDHADGTNPNDVITLNFGVVATDTDGDTASTTITVNVKDDAPDAVNDSRTVGEEATISGNVMNNDAVGQDVAGKVTQVVFNGVTTVVPASGNVVINGTYGTLTINSTGAYSYSSKALNADGTDNFTYTLKDYDGDTDTAILSIQVQDGDTIPTIITPAADVVDETSLSSGTIVKTGSVVADFGDDGPGTIAGNNVFSASGSKLGGALSSGGVPVVVSYANGVYTGKAGTQTVFTLSIGTDGSYTYRQFEQLDHADGTNPNDVITLNFGVVATDTDGDTASTTITVNVKDDAPDAVNDSRTVGEEATISGNVMNNDAVGQDVAGKVTQVVFNGVTTVVPASGNVVINGTYGTLTINSTGAYSYSSKALNADGTDNFTYTLKDYDGDTDTAILSIQVQDGDTIPTIITPAADVVDETSLSSGTIVKTGSVVADFGDDGPGTIAGNNVFSASGSKLGGALSSGGVPVVVSYANGVYTGKAGTQTVFTLSIGTDGSYTYRQFEQLDHADGTNPNDVITLNFGVVATDTDGDTASTTITVNVKDDAPDAVNDSRTVGEEATISGNVMNNDAVGQDVAGKVTQVVFNGVTTVVPASGNVVINGTYGTLTINSTGAYSYSSKALNADGTDNFTYTLKDYDGDTDTAILSIQVQDGDTIPTIITPAADVVDETSLSSGTIVKTGSVVADFGDDGPGTIAGNNVFSASGSKLGGALSSGGVPVVVSYANGVYTGKAGTQTVFTLSIGTDGSYTYRQFEQLDHADGTNPNDVITLNFGVVATDTDGDTASTTITVNVKDDAPDAVNDSRTVGEEATISGNVMNNDAVGQDVAGKVTQVVFNGVTTVVPASGNVVINGTYGTLTINSTGAYSYSSKALNADGTDNFTYTLKDYDGDTDTAILSIQVQDGDTIPTIITPAADVVDETSLSSGTIVKTGSVVADFGDDGPGTIAGNNVFSASGSKLGGALSSGGVPVVVSYANGVYTGKAGTQTVFTLSIGTDGSYTYRQFEQLDHADGTNPNDVITLNFGVVATDTDGDTASTTITVNVKDDAPDAVNDSRTVGEEATISGNVMNNDAVGQDVAGKVTQVVFNGVTTVVPASGNVVINGTYGTLTINSTGAYSYSSKALNADGTDNFTYTLKDYDGDTDTAILSIQVQDGDTIPTIITPAADVVDETSLSSGTIVKTGSVVADFGDDGPGTIAGNNVFSASGSKLGGALSSGGVPVVVSYANGVYTGKAGTQTVFTLSIGTDGSYTYRQFEQLDHADGTNPNDVITLNFGVVATDTDGDTASTTITVNVKDDAPDAVNDSRTVGEEATISGNVMNNDAVGQDVAGKVTQVVFNGVTTVVPASGNVVINGTYGTLTINSTGAYSYSSKALNADGTDNFTYTLKDYDGDTDTAILSIQVQDGDTIPTIITPAADVVDETSLSSGTIVKTGSVVADFGDDGPGTIAGNNVFSASGSKLGGALSSGGVPVVVSYANGVYTGKAGTQTVFTLSIGTDGSYTYRQFEQLDHADGTNPNDVITLNFGVVATDTDGDTASTTITVNVKDDAPDALADSCTLFVHQGSVSSNILANDISTGLIGQDTPGRVKSVSFGTTTVNVPLTGTASLTTPEGILVVAANGDYTYTLTHKELPTTSLNFAVTIADFDGDMDTQSLQINILNYTAGTPIDGSSGGDVIHGTSVGDTINGYDGDDWLWGEDGNDTINGGNGNDDINAGLGNDTVHGDAGADVITGREGDDTIYGGTGNDDLYGDAGGSETYGGNDKLYGEAGDDYISGGKGNDYIDGGTENDSLYGNDGVDTILGGAGNDHIIGGKGNDILTGGAGADTFWFMAINEGLDHIKDFSTVQGDKLELSNVLTNFDPVTDAINNFVFATHSGADTTILVNNAGTGIGGATAVAVLDGVNVTVTDLFNNGSIIA